MEFVISYVADFAIPLETSHLKGLKCH